MQIFEKGQRQAESADEEVAETLPGDNGTAKADSASQPTVSWFQHARKELVSENFEARGIRRVEPDERHSRKRLGYTQVAVLWFSINLAANNITLGGGYRINLADYIMTLSNGTRYGVGVNFNGTPTGFDINKHKRGLTAIEFLKRVLF